MPRGGASFSVILILILGASPHLLAGLVFPQFAAGGSVELELFLSNRGLGVAEGMVRFLDGEGQPVSVRVSGGTASTVEFSILPGGTFKLTASGAGSLASGYLLVDTEDPDSQLDGALVYRLADSQVSVPDSVLTRAGEGIIEVSQNGSSAIALVNLNRSSLDINLSAYDDRGALIDESRVTVRSGQRLARFLAEIFEGMDGFGLGTIRAAADQEFGMLLLRQTRDGVLSSLETMSSEAVNAPRGFGTITLDPDLDLDGIGKNVDTIAFWEAPNPRDTLMFVTAKGNELLEVWQFPFEGNEKDPVEEEFGDGRVNGVLVDQDEDLVYVTQAEPSRTLYVFSVPDLRLKKTIRGLDLTGEPNLGLLERPDGSKLLLVTGPGIVYVLDAGTGDIEYQFNPEIRSIETVWGDSFHQSVFVPDENTRQGIFTYHPDGEEFQKCDPFGSCDNLFGKGTLQDDGEGILIYHCFSPDGSDVGTGFIVLSDQRSDINEYEFFDRRTWRHLGTLRLTGVETTDGIASTQQALPGYPMGLFAAIDDDKSTVLLGWDKILEATGLSCP